jgi:large repetitive protein
MRSWLASRRSLIATATSGLVLTALVAVTAIVSTGYSAQRLDLNDASVWVANSADQYIGRANTEVLELNSVVESSSNDIQVVQSGSTVLVVDSTDAKLDVIDPATSTVLDSIALPPNQARVFLAGSNVVIYSQATGELWILALASLSTFDSTQLPSLNLGANSIVSVDPAGLLFGFSPDAGQVYRVDAAAAAVVQQTENSTIASAGDSFELSSVGGNWAVLDTDTATLETAAGVTELAALVQGTAVLQEPAVDGSAVLVGHAGGLLAVRADAGVTELASGRSGVAAAPTVSGGCEFAAWSDGSAWRHCAGEPARGESLDLSGMPGSPRLEFQSNADRVVLNDAQAGASWAVQSDGELIDNWDELISVLDDEQQVQQNDDSTPPETEQAQLPPVAVDDAYGARPGRASPMAVLINDYDPNGDVLVVSKVDALDPAIGRLDIIHASQAIQLTLAPGASGTVSFSYTISDGRGGTASATVTVSVRTEAENSPPVQLRQTRANVGSGGQVSLDVLGDWVDPDGDPFYLAAASVAAPNTVSYKADGTVVYSDSGSTGAAERTVTLTVTDGRAEGVGTLAVAVSPSGEVPILCDAFVVLAYAGVEVRVAPLEHVRGGNGAVRLNAVPPKSGVAITANFERGTFRVTSETVGTHYLDYVVADDVQTVTCVVRVDVAAPPDANTTPITVPKTVFITTLSSQTIDVASTDIDPGGGVLLVTGVMNLGSSSGVRAEVLEQRAVRITLTSLLSAPVTFSYRISNGLAEAEGTITVIEIPPPAQLQPPIARDDSATVRVGDAITIAVMDNDEQPDGESLSLDPQLVSNVGDDAGLLFVSGTTLRYLAPDHTGNFTATYRVLGPSGQTAEAQVTIQVREPTVDTNHAPAPGRITARVLAGEQVRIDIPLDGIDPDGDSVQLLGQETSPEKGTVVEVGSNYILYEAGEYSAGTDTFTYALIDALGARSTGTVRVGISARLEGARNPVAIDDEVRVRTGSSVSVQVLANDSDPDGGRLTVTGVEPSDTETVATIGDGGIVTITTPSLQGSYGLIYSIANERGGTSSAFIRVRVSDEAPLAYPEASDTVLTLSDILDRDTVDVSVLDRVFFADGAASELDVSVLPGYSAAEVLPNKQIRVTVGDERQIIPFAVAHPDDSSVRSFAFIWVPGFNDALPQIDRRAPRLVVTSEEPLTIDLNDYVIAVGGKQVRLTDSSTVSATHSDGSDLVVDRDTLRFTSADLYFGAASITFEVTDGLSATDPNGRKAILVLPIRVDPRENQPPSFNGAVIDFEPGQQKVIDLLQLTTYPYDDDLDELAYRVIDAAPVGFDYSLTGQQLTITARDNAVKNATTSITLGVRDAVNDGKAGRIELRVVPSTRPIARPAADSATTKRGAQTVIDVLANDEATNPFPGRPLTVLQVVGASGALLPAGVTVNVSADNSRITVDVAASAAPVDVNLQYQVADATNDPDRYAWGTVRISIQDVPDAPAKPLRQGNSFVNGELTLRIAPTQPNNSPVTNYRVISSSHGSYSYDCGTTLICSLPGLTVGELYSFQVVATNEIGDSAPSPLSDAFSIDYLPAAPASVTAVPSAPAAAPAGGSIQVSWAAVSNPNPGTPITGYTIVVVGAASTTAPAGATSATISGLANDVVYTVQVYARNSAQVVADSEWNRTATTVHTVGPPTAPAPAPQATSAVNGDIEVTWGPSGANGGGTVSYSIARVDGSAAPANCTAVAPLATGVASPYVDPTAVDGETYTYFVYASNGSYCTATATGPTVSLEAPGATSASPTVEAHGTTGQFDITATPSASGTVVKYQYLLSTDGVWRDLPAGGWATSLGSSGTAYGQPVDVSFRACRNDTDSYCGTPSATTTLTPVNARVAMASCSAGSGTAPSISEPANAGAVSVSVEVAYNQPILLVDNWSSFGSAGDPVPADATEMRVKATVNGYTDPAYGQFTCTP